MFKNFLKISLIIVFVLGLFPMQGVNAAVVSKSFFDENDSTYVVKLNDISKASEYLKKHTIKSFKQFHNGDWVEIKIDNLGDLVNLKKDSNIISLIKNTKRKISVVSPNDPYYSSTGTFQNSLSDQWDKKIINLQPVQTPSSNLSGWEITTGSTNTIVAVIDTGIDLAHPDLAANIWHNSAETAENSVDDDNNDYVDDVTGWNFADNTNNVQDTDGHGTHVSGIIAAVGNNSVGIAGTCWSCKIMPLKVVNSQGFAYDSDIATAIHYAVDNGAKIINMSLGGAGYSQLLQDATDYAWNNDVLVVSASGNDSGSASDSYPGGLNNSLSIGATNFLDNVPGFSNTGAKLDVVAPGYNVFSTKLQTLSGGCAGNVNYYCLTGTSMASPEAAGQAALIYDYHRLDTTPWKPNQIRNALLKSSHDLYNAGFDNTSGYGRIDALASLNYPDISSDLTAPVATLNALSSTRVKGNLDILGIATDTNLYIYTISVSRSSDNYIVKQHSGRSTVNNSILTTFDTTQISDGNYNIKMRVEDMTGNVTQSGTLNLDIDNTLPSNFSLINPTDNSIPQSFRPVFSWNVSTDASQISYDLYLDNSLYATDLSAASYTPNSDINQGNHTWYVNAKDVAGNITTSSTFHFSIDTLPPNNFNVNVEKINSSAKFTFLTTDSESGISHYDVNFNGNLFTNKTSPFQIDNLADGNYSVYVIAYDNANNSITSPTVNFTMNNRPAFLKTKADYNGDSIIDLTDLSILAQNYGKTTSTGDANGDGKVDLSDLSILAQNWKKTF